MQPRDEVGELIDPKPEDLQALAMVAGNGPCAVQYCRRPGVHGACGRVTVQALGAASQSQHMSLHRLTNTAHRGRGTA